MEVIVETFLNPGEPSSAVYRVRPIAGQVFSQDMRVQCSRAMRHAHPLGTRFVLPVVLVSTSSGAEFLREVGSGPWHIYSGP